MARLVRHSWPGNVRELRNVMERACLLARGSTINLEDALVSEAAPSLGIRTDLPFKEAKGQLVEMFEREYIEDLDAAPPQDEPVGGGARKPRSIASTCAS